MCYSRATLVPCPPHAPLPAALDYRRACFIVRDANGQALAYVYFEEEPGHRAASAIAFKVVEAARRPQAPACGGAVLHCNDRLPRSRSQQL